MEFRRCPHCRTILPCDGDECPACGAGFGAPRPGKLSEGAWETFIQELTPAGAVAGVLAALMTAGVVYAAAAMTGWTETQEQRRVVYLLGGGMCLAMAYVMARKPAGGASAGKDGDAGLGERLGKGVLHQLDSLREASRDSSVVRLVFPVCASLGAVGIAFVNTSGTRDLSRSALLSLVALMAVATGTFMAATQRASKGEGCMKAILVMLLLLASLGAGGFLLLYALCGSHTGLGSGPL